MNAHTPMQTNDPWAYFWDLGYRWLTPIIPPEAPMSPTSSIYKKIAKGKKDDRGKSPGVRLNNGLWVGHRFTDHRPTQRDTELWRDMGASIGVVLGEGLVAIDADCLQVEHAEICRAEIESRIGILPCRVGKAPKRLYVCRTSPDFQYRCVLFGPRDERGQQDSRVEILSTDRQFVAWGVHPGTMRPYEWVKDLLPLDELPYIEPAKLDGLMDALEKRLPQALPVEIGLARREVDQESLKAEKLDVALAAADALPNTLALYPRRNDYIKVGAAFKAMFAPWPGEGFKAWERWGERLPEQTNDHETMESDWRRIKAPFDVGAPNVYQWAAKHGGFNIATVYHEDVPDDPPAPPVSAWTQPASIFAGKVAAPQRWLVPDMIPVRTVTLLSGDGGTGKSLISLQLAFGAAVSGEWLGISIARGVSVFVTAEDEDEEVHRRLNAVANGAGLDLEAATDLHFRSLSGQDAVLAAPSAKTGLLEATNVFKALKAEVLRLRPSLLVLDTLADLFGGDEIKRVQARQFIQLLQSLVVAVDFDLSVVLLAHPSVAGMNSGTGTSGSTAWSNSVRSRLYLERRFGERGDVKIEIDPDIRVLSTKKANRTKQGGEITVRWVAGRFVAQTSTPERDTAADANDEGVFLALLDEFRRSERWVSPNPASPTYAARLFLTHPLGSEVGKKRLEGAMARLFTQNIIYVETYGYASKQHKRVSRRAFDLFW